MRDVATVQSGTEDHVRIVAGDGRPAALLNITRQIGGNTLSIADSIAAHRGESAKTLPPGVTLKPVYDQASLVRDAVKSVRDAMIIGAVLAVIMLLIFLRHARITAISASSIPLTMAITVFVMSHGRPDVQSDDARRDGDRDRARDRRRGRDHGEHRAAPRISSPTGALAIRDAVQELIWPVTTSTITTVVVFLPLGLAHWRRRPVLSRAVDHADDRRARVARPRAHDHSAAERAVSHERRRGGERVRACGGAPRGVLARVGRAIDSLADRYERALGARAAPYARWIIAIALVLIVAGVCVQLRRHRISAGNRRGRVRARLLHARRHGAGRDRPPGAHRREDSGARRRKITGTSRRTGAELGLFATEQNRGDIIGASQSRRRPKPLELRGDRRRARQKVHDRAFRGCASSSCRSCPT